MQETQETRVHSLGWEDSLEKGMATHCSILDWRIPWTEEPGRLQSVGHKVIKLLKGADQAADRCLSTGSEVLIKQLIGADQAC